MNKTSISYLTHTWNPLAMRCTPVSAGCQNCWHIAMAKRMAANPKIPAEERAAYAGGAPVLRLREIEAPLRMKAPAVIGVQFMGDMFHEAVTIEQIDAVWGAMARSTQHLFILLTKRPQRMNEYTLGLQTVDGAWRFEQQHRISPNPLHGYAVKFRTGKPLQNVILGVSVENQASADERIPWLLRTPAAKRIVSAEPLLGPIDIDAAMYPEPRHGMNGFGFTDGFGYEFCLHAVYAGGETGPKARPCHPDWARALRDQCISADVVFHWKSWGEWITKERSSPNEEMWPPFTRVHCCNPDTLPPYPFCRDWAYRVGSKHAGRLIDGVLHNGLVEASHA